MHIKYACTYARACTFFSRFANVRLSHALYIRDASKCKFNFILYIIYMDTRPDSAALQLIQHTAHSHSRALCAAANGHTVEHRREMVIAQALISRVENGQQSNHRDAGGQAAGHSAHRDAIVKYTWPARADGVLERRCARRVDRLTHLV